MRCGWSTALRSRSFRSARDCRSALSSSNWKKEKEAACCSATGSACARPSAGGSSSTSCWRFSSAKVQIADRVSESLAPRRELRRRPGRKAARCRLEQRLGGEDRLHLLGIIRPVGRRVQHAARRELARKQRRDIRLHQPALVVALLRPWIREEEVD